MSLRSSLEQVDAGIQSLLPTERLRQVLNNKHMLVSVARTSSHLYIYVNVILSSVGAGVSILLVRR